MSPEQFIEYLKKHCQKSVESLSIWDGNEYAQFPAGKLEAYKNINSLIDIYNEQYKQPERRAS